MKTLKIWGGGGYENAENIRGGLEFVQLFGGGGKLCLSWGGGGVIVQTYRGGVSLYHSETCGGKGYSWYKFVQNVGGGEV